ncbi:substrate-binding domain-containing protein [Jiangella rhizosphaerae]|uniref:ABC transporter substrate-binding protein n=1 Tax=Jiangella rhizosphaerae TaxID=2293569 RepID=A0A418KJ99_9ACTN|nr:substrate-binding domain-containing protein [Jiangella rhizosphaerae]RIQ13702.1 ABC transporter substrate-binding protein [Jiangella rhizosphaerae]
MSRSTRTLAALCGSALLFTAACGTESDVPESAGGDATPEEGAECAGADGEYLIGMSQANVAEPYRQQMDDDIEAAAAEVDQFEVVFADAAQDNAKQVADVENFLTQGIDLLIISPNEAAPLTAVVERAYNEGIPVIVLDRKIESDAYTQFIGADNTEIGRAAGEYVATELLPDGGTVAELKGLPGSTPAQERADGFREGIAANPGIEIVAEGVGDWLREKGQSQFEAILQANQDIDVVYAHNDPMAEGAYLAAQAAGRETEMRFIGIDALPIPSGGIKAVEEGRLSATFVYPTGGKEAIATAQQILVECADVEKEQILDTELITQENAAEVYARNATQ